MRLLWVAADSVGSKLVRWGLDSDCSHFAICFDEDSDGGGIVFHSYGKGTQLEWLEEFRKHYYIVHCMEPEEELSLEAEEKVYKEILRGESGRVFDYAGIIYFGLVALWNKITGSKKLPSSNKWQKKNMRLCTGIAPAVFKALGIHFPEGVDPEMIAPHTLFRYAQESMELRNTIL